jgi:hypothetical protein
MSKVVPTLGHHHLFSKQTGEYMVAYSILDNNNSKEVVGGSAEGRGRSDNEPYMKTIHDILPNQKDREAIQGSRECCRFRCRL